MSEVKHEPSVSDAARDYLSGLPEEEVGPVRTEVFRFIRWFGKDRVISQIAPSEVDNFAERLSVSDTEYLGKLECIRGFLQYSKKKGWCKTNLAAHLKARKSRSGKKMSSVSRQAQDTISMTQEGYDKLSAELESLKNARYEVIEEVRKAAADKDFRENAPLHAARERRGKIEGRIMEVEATLKASEIIDTKRNSGHKVCLGDSVVLCDVDSGQEMCYKLVSSSEVNPVKGKISAVSPIGKALIDRQQGETVEITAPVGKMRYQIKQVSR
jgi:transcription elongation factor GreA